MVAKEVCVSSAYIQLFLTDQYFSWCAQMAGDRSR